VELLKDGERISPKEYKTIISSNKPHYLLDVREEQELGICALPSVTKNVPYSRMNSESVMESLRQDLEGKAAAEEKLPGITIGLTLLLTHKTL